MEKLKMFLKRLSRGSLKKFFMHISLIHKETGKNRVWLFFDMGICILVYKMGYSDYHCFGFANVRGKARKTFLNMNDSITISRKLNSRENFDIFDDKAQFNKAFSDLLGREWLDLRNASKEEFSEFCKGKSAVFTKLADGVGGTGVSKEEISENTDLSALYDKLVAKKYFVVEEEITQHEKMKSLAPSSVNTLRVTTLRYEGKTHVMYTLLRISDGKNFVDNVCSGGMYTPVGFDGVVRKPAYCSETGEFYEPHPFSKVSFVGFEIPFYHEAVEMVKNAAERFPDMGYLGWDVAFTPTRPILIEANNMPSYDLSQNYGHLDEKIGLKPKFEEILGKDFFKK